MQPTQFSLEHLPRSLSPDGRIDSAPRNLSVLGLQSPDRVDPVPLGDFVYDGVRGDPIQFFPVETNQSFSHVELVIRSNHGNLNYTCLYRFRVHGVPKG